MEDYFLKIVLPYLASNAPAAMMALCLLYIRGEVTKRFQVLESEIKRLKKMVKKVMNKHTLHHLEDAQDLFSGNDEDDNPAK